MKNESGKNQESSLLKKDSRKCCVCDEEYEKSITHGFEVKGKKKYICKDCADAVHGLV